jgi:ribosomal protein S18 acetylase RimI-like enzyme
MHRELKGQESSEMLTAIRRLYLGAFPEYERASFESVFVDRDKDRSVLAGFLPDGSLAGFAVLLPLRRHQHIFLLEYLAVVPRLRSSGVGRNLLDACRAHVETLGGDRILLEVENPNLSESSTNARRRWAFYTRNHVKPVGGCKSIGCPASLTPALEYR